MATKIQLRRDTASNWASNNPVLFEGEPAIETDTLRMKVGNGTTAWNSLDYSVRFAGNTDGGSASSNYLNTQLLDGGSANG